jgi:hypothetical protein
MVLSRADGFSSACFPTLVPPDAVLLDFLALREDSDAVLLLFLRFAPPLNSIIDWMLVPVVFWMPKGMLLMFAEDTSQVDAINMDAKQRLWNFKGLMMKRTQDEKGLD